jgi:hypothetical protein
MKKALWIALVMAGTFVFWNFVFGTPWGQDDSAFVIGGFIGAICARME